MRKIFLLTALLLGSTALISTSSKAEYSWTKVDENNDIRYAIQYNDTLWASGAENSTWTNQAAATTFANSNKTLQEALQKQTGCSTIAEAVKNTDTADKKYDEAVEQLERYADYREQLRKAYAEQNNIPEDQVTDAMLDSLTDEQTWEIYKNSEGTDSEMRSWMAESEKEKYAKQKEEYADQTWDAVEKTIRDSVHNDELLSGDGYANGTDIAELFGVDSGKLINTQSGITTKDEAYEHYYNQVQADLESNPEKYTQAVKTLQSYDSNLSSLDMTNDASRDYIASYVAAIASEHQKLE